VHVCVCVLLTAVVCSCASDIWQVLLENSEDNILLSKYLNKLSLFALKTTINLYLVNDSAVNGSVVNDSAVNGSVVNDSAVNGSAVNDSAVNVQSRV